MRTVRRTLARLDPADRKRRFALGLRSIARGGGGIAATTSAMPMPQLNTRSISVGATPPVRASQREHRRHRPVRGVQRGGRAVGQHARQIAGQAAAGDVRRRLQQPRAMQRQQRADIDPRRRQQRLAQRLLRARTAPARPRPGRWPRRPGAPGKTRWNARRYWPAPAPRRRAPRRAAAACRARPRRPRSPRDRSRRRHTCPASRRSRRRPARSRPAGSPRRCRRSPSAACADVEPAGREIVEEEQRLGALHDQVVDAHRHQVDADRVVQAGLDGELQLGADAVGGGDQDRVGEAGRASGRTARRSRRCRPARRRARWRAPAA